MSGHSKWATIKRKKGALDAARGKVFTKLIREIVTAARLGGGDPSGNARLRKALDDAKAQQMPADTAKRAVQRGSGEVGGAAYEDVLYEGTGAAGTLFLVEGSTDNRNRSAAELRKVFERHGGTMGGSGTAAWAFDRRGTLALPRDQVTEDQLMEVLLGAGADDYRDEGDTWLVVTAPEDYDRVLTALSDAKLPLGETRLAYLPKNRKEVSGDDARRCLELAEALDDHDDVQAVFADFDLSEEELAGLSG